MATAQKRYVEILFEQIRHVQYPSVELMDRLERSLETREQLDEYMGILFDRVESCQYPSKQLLDRIERLAPYASGNEAGR
jgi:hypothetical protein